MTFKEYLATRRVTDTLAGDFTTDARSDRRLPNVTTWPELRRYVEGRAGLATRAEAVAAAYQVWQGYQVALRNR